MTILDAIPDAKCLVVTTPQEISLADVRKRLISSRSSKRTCSALWENMSGLFCPHCGEEIDLQEGWRRSPQTGRLNFLGAIPLDPATVIAADRGHPIVSMPADTARRRPHSQARRNRAEATQA